jgi:hypothetical protein
MAVHLEVDQDEVVVGRRREKKAQSDCGGRASRVPQLRRL